MKVARAKKSAKNGGRKKDKKITTDIAKNTKSSSAGVRNNESYRLYINKLLKKQDPPIGTSHSALSIYDSITKHLFQSIARESMAICMNNKKKTLSSRELTAAVHIIMPNAIAKRAINCANKSIESFKGSLVE